MKTAPSLIGGILLVIGNVIGAGMLALPIATAQLGILSTIGLLTFFWGLVYIGALYFLEGNLYCPPNSNLITMSRQTLGRLGTGIAWVCNLLVLYSLIAAYIAGGSDLLRINLSYIGISLPLPIAALAFLGIFGFIVYRGIALTDYTNRILMCLKLTILIVLVGGLGINVMENIYIPFEAEISGTLLIVALTSFGFAPIIPSLRNYYQSDVKKIKAILFLGSFIPLLCYIAWVTVIFGVIPQDKLINLTNSSTPVSDLQTILSLSLHIGLFTQAINLFSALCLLTSFLVNSISLTDFIADGFRLHMNKKKRILTYFIAYLPPLLAVIIYPKAFLLGLSVAGILAIIQLLILPGFIVWKMRYSLQSTSLYRVPGEKLLLGTVLAISIGLLLWVGSST